MPCCLVAQSFCVACSFQLAQHPGLCMFPRLCTAGAVVSTAAALHGLRSAIVATFASGIPSSLSRHDRAAAENGVDMQGGSNEGQIWPHYHQTTEGLDASSHQECAKATQLKRKEITKRLWPLTDTWEWITVTAARDSGIRNMGLS